MPTIQQLIRKPRQPKVKRSKSQHLERALRNVAFAHAFIQRHQKAELRDA